MQKKVPRAKTDAELQQLDVCAYNTKIRVLHMNGVQKLVVLP